MQETGTYWAPTRNHISELGQDETVGTAESVLLPKQQVCQT